MKQMERKCAHKTPGPGRVPPIRDYGKLPPETGTFCNLQVYEKVGISQIEVYERGGKSVIKT